MFGKLFVIMFRVWLLTDLLYFIILCYDYDIWITIFIIINCVSVNNMWMKNWKSRQFTWVKSSLEVLEVSLSNKVILNIWNKFH